MMDNSIFEAYKNQAFIVYSIISEFLKQKTLSFDNCTIVENDNYLHGLLNYRNLIISKYYKNDLILFNNIEISNTCILKLKEIFKKYSNYNKSEFELRVLCYEYLDLYNKDNLTNLYIYYINFSSLSRFFKCIVNFQSLKFTNIHWLTLFFPKLIDSTIEYSPTLIKYLSMLKKPKKYIKKYQHLERYVDLLFNRCKEYTPKIIMHKALKLTSNEVDGSFNLFDSIYSEFLKLKVEKEKYNGNILTTLLSLRKYILNFILLILIEPINTNSFIKNSLFIDLLAQCQN